MSLLDDVSIVVTPNGYKAGELYAVVPVPTEGAELVTNGDFATDTDWAKVNSTISGGIATINGTISGTALLYQNILTNGRTYNVEFTVLTNDNNAQNKVWNNDGSNLFLVSGTGLKTFQFTHSIASGNFLFQANGGVYTISNVSVKEYTSADMDVTRATAATRVDENGLVNYAEIIGGEEVTNGDYTEAGVGNVISQSGGILVNDSNRLKITSDGSSGFSRGVWDTNGSQGERFIIKADVISITGGVRFIDISNNAGTSLVSGTTFEIEIILGSAAKQVGFGGFSDTSFELILDNVSVKEAARDNVPRIDYTGGGCPHILAEPQRTNLIPYSSDFSQWILNSVTLTANATTSPSGSLDATLVDLSSTTDSRLVNNVGVVASTEDTLSFYLKKHESDSDGTFPLAYYDGSNYIKTYVNLTDVWQRFDLTFTNPSGSTFGYGLSRKGTTSDETLTRCYAWGSQLEQASYPTSLIPTSGSTVTRNQDIFTRDGISSLINSTEGVLFVEMALLIDDDSNKYITLTDVLGANKVQIDFDYSSSRLQYVVASGGYAQCNIKISYSGTNMDKLAFKWKENDFAVWINGVEIGSDTSGLAPIGLNTLKFSAPTGSNNFAGKVKQLQVYDTALTDEQLLQLTGESGTDFYESYAEMASALTYTIQ